MVALNSRPIWARKRVLGQPIGNERPCLQHTNIVLKTYERLKSHFSDQADEPYGISLGERGRRRAKAGWFRLGMRYWSALGVKRNLGRGDFTARASEAAKPKVDLWQMASREGQHV